MSADPGMDRPWSRAPYGRPGDVESADRAGPYAAVKAPPSPDQLRAGLAGTAFQPPGQVCTYG
jgi:hypothetical protein